MASINWNRYRRVLEIEIRYIRNRFRLSKFFILILSLIQLIVISLGDVQSFFLNENFLIPRDWYFLQKPTTIKIISLVFIVLIYLLFWLVESKQQENEINDLGKVINGYTVPLVEQDLKRFINRIIKQRYNMSSDVRASIFLPVRIGFLKWRLQMVCRTEKITDKELDALFKLDEGVLGYAFMRANKYHVEFLDISNPHNLPIPYIPLNKDNRSLIEQDLKAVTVFVFYQKNFISGFLAIDTTNPNDIKALEDTNLHDNAVNWMREQKESIELLWRMKNNV